MYFDLNADPLLMEEHAPYVRDSRGRTCATELVKRDSDEEIDAQIESVRALAWAADDGVHQDTFVLKLGLSMMQVLRALLALEISGQVKQARPRVFERVVGVWG